MIHIVTYFIFIPCSALGAFVRVRAHIVTYFLPIQNINIIYLNCTPTLIMDFIKAFSSKSV